MGPLVAVFYAAQVGFLVAAGLAVLTLVMPVPTPSVSAFLRVALWATAVVYAIALLMTWL